MDYRQRKPREIFDYYDGVPVSFAIRDDGDQLYYGHYIGETDSSEPKYAYRGCTTDSLGEVLQQNRPVGEFLRNPNSEVLYEVTYMGDGSLRIRSKKSEELPLPDTNVFM